MGTVEEAKQQSLGYARFLGLLRADLSYAKTPQDLDSCPVTMLQAWVYAAHSRRVLHFCAADEFLVGTIDNLSLGAYKCATCLI